MRNKWDASYSAWYSQLSANVIRGPALIDHRECVGSYQKNASLVWKGLVTGLRNILYPVISVVLVWYGRGKEAAYSTESQYFIVKSQFQPCFYSLPRTPSRSHGRGSWFKPDPKKSSLDGTHRSMTRRGQGQGGDPKGPPGQKQWVTLGLKYRLWMSLRETTSWCWSGWVGLLGRAREASPMCQPLLCQPSFSEWLCPYCSFYSSLEHLTPFGSFVYVPVSSLPSLILWSWPLLSLVSCRPYLAPVINSRCFCQSVALGALG